MYEGYQEKICLVTGGSGGIGYPLVEGLSRKGYTVISTDIIPPKKEYSTAIYMDMDIRSEDSINTVFSAIIKKYGAIHILINNAGIAWYSKNIIDITCAEVDAILDVNLRGAFLCSKAFVKAHTIHTYGRIINIASTWYNQNESHWEVYGASKGGLVALSSSLAISLSNTSITVNAISPGWIHTGNYSTLTQKDHSQHPSGRVGKPQDIINACLFLMNEENDFINGANIVVDGGMSKKMIYE